MTTLQTKITTDNWFGGSWDEYLQTISQSEHQQAKGYYYQGKLRLEMSPLGNAHSKDHYLISCAVGLFACLKKIPLNGHDNCTYRKAPRLEAQPDLSYYIGNNADAIPWGTTIINLDNYPAPNLVIEVGNTTLTDDLGTKRLLYEDLQVQEYWVIDVQNGQVIAFAIVNQGSNRITQSQALTGLNMGIITEALQLSRKTNHTEVSNWLLQQFQA